MRTFQEYVPLPHVFPPFAIRQSPTGRATLGSRTLSGVASLCHSLRWCKKNTAHPQLRTLVWCSALPSSSPLLLAFRLRTSECLYKNAQNKQTANKKGTHPSAFYYYQNLILGLRRFLLPGCQGRLLQGFLRLQPLLLFHRQGLLLLQGLSCPF